MRYKSASNRTVWVGTFLCEVVSFAFSMVLGLIRPTVLCIHSVMENKWATADRLFSWHLLQPTALSIVKTSEMSAFGVVHSHNHRLAVTESYVHWPGTYYFLVSVLWIMLSQFSIFYSGFLYISSVKNALLRQVLLIAQMASLFNTD